MFASCHRIFSVKSDTCVRVRTFTWRKLRITGLGLYRLQSKLYPYLDARHSSIEKHSEYLELTAVSYYSTSLFELLRESRFRDIRDIYLPWNSIILSA
jgi:hypothetical protein